MDAAQFITTATTWIIPVLLAVTLHEAAHGYVAWWLGDDTAYRQGRVTLNPLSHVDPVGTVLVPATLLIMHAPFLFGWARPVPVAFGRLGSPRRDMMLVAAAGPAANMALAAISAILIHVLPLAPEAGQTWLAATIVNSIVLNMVLFIFNLMPLPPLDGGRIVTGLLPLPLAVRFARLEPYGMLILLSLFIVLPVLGRQLGIDLDLFGRVIDGFVTWIMPFFLALGGVGGGQA